MALSKTPTHRKALVRAAECCVRLQRFRECLEACDRGLEADPRDDVLLGLRKEAVAKEKEAERNRRREAAEAKKRKVEEEKLLRAIEERGIVVKPGKKDGDEEEGLSPLSMSLLEPAHPSAVHRRVHFSPKDPSKLVWPVLLLYPEHGETDLVEAFEEDARFSDHLEVMFGEEVEAAPWDADGKYRARDLRVYFEDTRGGRLWEVDVASTLGEGLQRPGYRVLGGTPGFIVMVEGSDFQRDFVKKYRHK